MNGLFKKKCFSGKEKLLFASPKMKLLSEYLLCIVLFPYINGYKILGLFPHPATSHFNVFQPILRRLADDGHEVTVVSHFPDPNSSKNYKDLTLQGETLTNAISLQVS